MCRINPRVDFAFKKLFGSEENSDLLLSLVNSVLQNAYLQENREFIPIVAIELKNPFNLPDYLSGKMTILDIKAQDNNGVWYDIEMQLAHQSFFEKRAMYYWSQVYVNQLKRKGAYHELNKVIFISLLDYNFFDGDSYHHIYRLLNSLTHKELGNFCEVHFIELNKMRKERPTVLTPLERWIDFLTNAVEYNRKNTPTGLDEDLMIKEAIERLEVLSMTDEEYEIYLDREKQRMEYIGAIHTAMTMGREEGRERGREEGKMEIVKNLLRKDFSIQEISEMTGLSEEVILRIR